MPSLHKLIFAPYSKRTVNLPTGINKKQIILSTGLSAEALTLCLASPREKQAFPEKASIPKEDKGIPKNLSATCRGWLFVPLNKPVVATDRASQKYLWQPCPSIELGEKWHSQRKKRVLQKTMVTLLTELWWCQLIWPCKIHAVAASIAVASHVTLF